MSKYTLLLVLLLLQGRQDSTLVFVSRFLLVFFSALFSIGNCSFPVGHDPGDADYMSKLLKALNPTPPGWSENTSFCQWNGVNCTQPHSGRPPRVNAISLPSSSLSGELPQDLNSLSQLTHLDLRNNSLSGPIPSLADLSSLETVYLADNYFALIPSGCFLGLTALQTLSLSNNPNLPEWSFPTELVQSRSLRTLELANMNIVGELPAGMFDWFPSLQSVNLSSNSEIGGSLPESLGRSQIRHLWLDYNKFTGPIPDLSNCTDLSDLQLRNNKLTGLVPPWLMALPSLQNLSLDNNL